MQSTLLEEVDSSSETMDSLRSQNKRLLEREAESQEHVKRLRAAHAELSRAAALLSLIHI